MIGDIKVWWKYCVNKIRVKYLRKFLFDNYPWDNTMLYEMQECWLKEAIAYYEGAYPDLLETDANLKDMVRWIRKAYALLQIILEKEDISHIECNLTSKDPKDWTIVTDVYVNLRNAHRFKYRCANWGQTTPDNIPVYRYSTSIYHEVPDELYKKKALHLYHKILYEHAETWWD